MLDSLVKVTLPEMGESVTEGSIVEWRKKVGQWVDEGDTLVDVTTDKVDVEVPSTASGVISAVHGAEGDTIAVGSVLVEIDTKAAKPAGEPAAAASAPAAKPAGELVTPSSYGAAGSAAAPPERRGAGGGALAGIASHHARRLAERFGLDLSSVKGSGPDGLVLREDVEAAMAAGTVKAATNGAAKAPTARRPSPTRRSRHKRRSPNSRVRPRRWPATWTRALRSRRRRRSAPFRSARSKRAAPNSTPRSRRPAAARRSRSRI